MSYLLRSSISREVLVALKIKDQCPIMLAHATKIARSNISTKLGELSKRGMVECINPQDRKFRFYKITPHGKEVLANTLIQRKNIPVK